MNYFTNHLLTDEKYIQDIELHKIIFIYGALFSILGITIIGGGLIFIGSLSFTLFGYHPLKIFFYLGLAFIAYSIWQSVHGFLLLKYSEFVITNKRILIKTGIFSKEIDETWINKIQSIDLKQSLFGRIFNYGELKIKILDEEKPYNPVFIKSPEDFKKLLLSLKEDNKLN